MKHRTIKISEAQARHFIHESGTPISSHNTGAPEENSNSTVSAEGITINNNGTKPDVLTGDKAGSMLYNDLLHRLNGVGSGFMNKGYISGPDNDNIE